MKLERVRPGVVRVTAHSLELAAVISAARWVAEGAQGTLPPDATERLREVLASYDEAMARLNTSV